MKILVTGAAGFIGSYVAERFLNAGHEVTGLDNINDYYDPQLKYDRLERLGIPREDAERWCEQAVSSIYGDRFRFVRMNLEDSDAIAGLFAEGRFDLVVNLAAQAGVRYSITNPQAYVKSNIDGFMNVLEGCRNNGVKHLVYASSSSVYGLNGKVPFSEKDGIAHPVSLYAATKKANELMAHAYSQLYGIPTTGLRFFTVYGPWGRPDMSPHLFMDAILSEKPLKVFNNGDMWRDFTFIDDIVEGVVRISEVVPSPCGEWDPEKADPSCSSAPYRVYNVGNSTPTRLMDYISCIENATGKEAEKEFLPMQPGDVYQTYADSSALAEATGFRPATPLAEGIARTVEWFRNYYGKGPLSRRLIMEQGLEIDLVYMWVDGSDPKWLEKHNRATGKTDESSDVNSKARFVNNDELKYSLRSVERYAPWIRHIFIVTDNQVPEWLDTSNPRVTIVDHSEILPEKSRPCFNSTLIEHFIYKIPGLAEHYILANDDMMLNKPLKPSDFFDREGFPVMRLVRRPFMRLMSWLQINVFGKKMGNYKTQLRNSALLVKRRSGKYYEGKPHHNMDAYNRVFVEHVEDVFKKEFEPTFEHPIRDDADFQRIVYYYMGMAEGKGRPEYVDKHTSFQLSVAKPYHYERLEKYDPVFFCMNDSPKATDAQRLAAKDYLSRRFPDKSQFEK